VIEEGLKLSVYLGERDRVDGRLLANALIDIYERHGMRTSALLRGVEGFGIKHRLHTERLLTLSEDLPMLALAVDSRARVEALAEEVRGVSRHGVITLERALLVVGRDGELELPPGPTSSSSRSISGARSARADCPRTWPWSICCIATASPARACCLAWMEPRTARASEVASSPATRRCR
jgi:PII-like signaling protein